MFYSKPLLTKKVTNYKVSFSAFQSGMNSEIDEGILPYKYAKSCYNYCIENGALKDGIGFESVKFPKSLDDLETEREILLEKNEQPKALWVYKYFDAKKNVSDYRLMFYITSGKIKWFQIITPYIYTFGMAGVLYSEGVPNAVNYRLNGVDYMIFSSATDGMWKYTAYKTAQKIENGPSIVSMCLHYERLFAIVENGERNRLSFSANLDPTNWNESLDEGGFIDMQDERGPLNCVVSFNDYVYVFRDFGVARVSAYGDQSSFSVSQLFVSSSKIYGKSVCVCGDQILFLARDGLHTFNGSTTSKLTLGIESLLKNVLNENCTALYHNGKYYLACKLNFNDDEKVGCENYSDGYVNNALIEYNLNTGEVSVSRGIDICSMVVVDNGYFCKVLACFNGEYRFKIGQMTRDGKLFGEPLKKCWVSPKSNLSYPTKMKRVKEVLVKTKSACKVKIETEKGYKIYNVVGSNKTQRLKTNVYGEQIEISFISQTTDTTEISCPQITIGVTA